jgi:pimeloyl-ACP methyl ester carboxylesterase
MRVFEDASHVLWWAREFLAMTADTSIGGGLRRYPGPILCVLGTADSLMGYERLRAYCGGLPRVTIATVKGGSHYLVTEHAPLVARLIREFVDHGGLVATRSPRVDAGRLQILPPSADERIAATLSPLATS